MLLQFERKILCNQSAHQKNYTSAWYKNIFLLWSSRNFEGRNLLTLSPCFYDQIHGLLLADDGPHLHLHLRHLHHWRAPGEREGDKLTHSLPLTYQKQSKIDMNIYIVLLVISKQKMLKPKFFNTARNNWQYLASVA